MGGMHGFRRVQREENEPVFHEEWEKSVVAMSRVTGALGITNIDESRYGIEQMDPAKYLTSSYYERWLDRSIRNFIARASSNPRSCRPGSSKSNQSETFRYRYSQSSNLSASLVSQVRAGRRS